MTDNPWTAIVAALETATEGSREIDAAFALALGWTVKEIPEQPPPYPAYHVPGSRWRWVSPSGDKEQSMRGVYVAGNVPSYSADLNAIVAAVEAEPLINCHGYDKDPIGVQAHVSRNNVSEGHFLFEGTHCDPADALCLAFAKMKEASHD